MKINLAIKPLSIPKPIRGLAEKYSTYLLPVVSGIVVLILLFTIVRPRIGAIFQLRSQISQSQQRLVTLETKLLTLKSFNPDQLLADVRKAEIALPSEKDLPSLLSVLERLAAETGVTIAAIQLTPGVIQPTTGKDGAENFPVKITIAGNFFQIKSFFASIVNSPKVMAVRSSTITSGLTGQQASLSATLNLESFFQSLSATKFTAGEPLQSLTAEEKQVLGKIVLAPQVVTTAPPITSTGKTDPFAPF